MDRRADIRDYMISRRAKITPDQAGLHPSDGDIRRVPGLRREEVARLAAVSVDYYTELERGGLDKAALQRLARANAPRPATPCRPPALAARRVMSG